VYEFLKHIAKTLLPKQTLLDNEAKLRRITSLFYKGKDVLCPICQQSFRKFILLDSGEKLCPSCGSLARHRRLFFLLEGRMSGKTVLDFSPSRALYRRFKKVDSIQYVASDYSNEFLSDKKLDITFLEEEDESFDLVICYHILEHIENDKLAMKELYRVLKNSGECWIQTPFKEGEIYEDQSISDSKQRGIHFGQEDHVRIYSVNGLKDRLEKTGFLVEVNSYKAEAKYGFEEEIILIAKK